MTQLENYWNWHWDSGLETGHRDQFNFLGYTKLANNFVFIRDDFVFDCLYEVGQECFTKQIQKCVVETNRIPIFCLDNNILETSYVDQVLLQILDKKEYFILTYDANMLYSSQSNIGYWPYFLIRQFLENNLTPNTKPIIQPKKYRISYLSGISRYHRLLLASKLKRHFSQEDVVVINKFNERAYIDTIPRRLMSDKKSKEKALSLIDEFPWSTNNRYFDNDYSRECINKPWDISHPAYKAMINITGETSCSDNEIFITEKTWKAYQAGSLVINYGPKNLPTFLKHIGVEIIEDIDPSLSFFEKNDFLDMVLGDIDVLDLYYKNKEIIDHNVSLIYSEAFLEQLSIPTIEKMQDMTFT